MSQPATRQVASIAACLPEQFWASGEGASLEARQRGGRQVEREVGGVLQVVDAQARAVEYPPDPVEVRRLASVTGGGEGEQLAGEVEAGPQHRHGLHRRARSEGRR